MIDAGIAGNKLFPYDRLKHTVTLPAIKDGEVGSLVIKIVMISDDGEIIPDVKEFHWKGSVQ